MVYDAFQIFGNGNKQEDPLRSYSLISAIVCLFVLIIVLKFVGNEKYLLSII